MNLEEAYNNYELSYELSKFDVEFTYWPVRIADFVIRMGEIPMPINQLPLIGSNKVNRVAQLSDEEIVLVYNRLDTIFKKFTPLVGQYRIPFLNISTLPLFRVQLNRMWMFCAMKRLLIFMSQTMSLTLFSILLRIILIFS